MENNQKNKEEKIILEGLSIQTKNYETIYSEFR